MKDLKEENIAKQMVEQSQGQPRINLTPQMIKNATTVTCDCGGNIFTEKLVFKKMSAILSPTGKEEVIPMPVVVCEECGKVPTVFDKDGILPKEVKAKKTEK